MELSNEGATGGLSTVSQAISHHKIACSRVWIARCSGQHEPFISPVSVGCFVSAMPSIGTTAKIGKTGRSHSIARWHKLAAIS